MKQVNDLTKAILDHRQHAPVKLPDDARPRLVQLKDIRAVVFDVYGTLFSSGVGDISLATKQNRDEAVKAALQQAGGTVSPTGRKVAFDAFLNETIVAHQDRQRTKGASFPEVDIREVWADLVESLAEQGYLVPDFEIEIESLAVDYESRVNPVQPMPGLVEVLTDLSQMGCVMSIISNAQFYTPLLFNAFMGKSLPELGFCLTCSVWSYQLLEAKPSVRLYQLAAERLHQHHGIDPANVLYIGNDMLNDMVPANAVGFRTGLFAGDQLSLRRRRDITECANLETDLELTSLDQIIPLLSS